MHAHYRHLFGGPCNQLLLNNPLLDDHPVMKSITVSTVFGWKHDPSTITKPPRSERG